MGELEHGQLKNWTGNSSSHSKAKNKKHVTQILCRGKYVSTRTPGSFLSCSLTLHAWLGQIDQAKYDPSSVTHFFHKVLQHSSLDINI